MTVVGRRGCTRTEGLRAYYHYSTATITTITIRFRSLIGMVIKGYQGMGRGTQRRICKTGSYQMYFNMADVLVLADALGPSLLPLQQWYDFLGHGFRGARRTQVVRRVIGLIIAHYPPDGGGGESIDVPCVGICFSSILPPTPTASTVTDRQRHGEQRVGERNEKRKKKQQVFTFRNHTATAVDGP